MAENKMTKVEYFGELRTLVENASELDNEVQDELLAFVDKEVELLKNKAEKAKERAAKRKVEGDELREKVAACLGENLKTIDTIVAEINDEEITKAMVVARLTQLVKLGEAYKEPLKEEGSKRSVMAYCLPLPTEEAAE